MVAGKSLSTVQSRSSGGHVVVTLGTTPTNTLLKENLHPPSHGGGRRFDPVILHRPAPGSPAAAGTAVRVVAGVS